MGIVAASRADLVKDSLVHDIATLKNIPAVRAWYISREVRAGLCQEDP